MRLTDEVNAALALCRHQGGFRPCPPEEPCGNCGCPLSSHFHATTAKVFDTACGLCPCQHWYCRHGGHRIAVPGT